ncbi:MAG: sensor histidine kinase [Bacteroidales bacterium]|nr:sensor histidine kinase [Bacteroidales bacterium]
MIRLIALILSILLLIIASSVALSFIKLTKHRSVSWLFLSLAFVFMAVIKVVELFEYLQREPSHTWQVIDEWLGVLVSVFIVVGVFLIRNIFVYLKKTDIDRTRTEQRVLRAIVNTEETERQRFAKDLHDGLGPLLSAIKMSLSALNGKFTEESDKKILDNTSHLVNEAINTIKDISNNISPHILTNFGLESALGTFISKLNQTGVTNIEFKSNFKGERLDSDKEVVIYRAACELLNNAVKHSGASKIEIELNRSQKIFTLNFSDNGRGFDLSKLDDNVGKGMGISNIESRVKSVGGVFVLESVPGRGTSALIKIVD